MARERSRREKIQHFPSPGPVLTKMCKFLAMVRKISLDFLARSCWREKKSTFSLAGGSQREKIWFFYQRNSCHELNQPDLSRLMVSRERNCGLVIKVLCSLNELRWPLTREEHYGTAQLVFYYIFCPEWTSLNEMCQLEFQKTTSWVASQNTPVVGTLAEWLKVQLLKEKIN